MTDYGERSPAAECTRDPIFLLQSRRFGYPDVACNELSDTVVAEGWARDDEGEIYRENGERITESEFVEMGYAFEYWETERVFFTRKEAEVWTKARAYNYISGYRIYSVCAEGQLIEILTDAERRKKRES